MIYTEEQRQQIRDNLQKIVDYIEENILPHITYSYDTGEFGPIGDKNYRIGLNGPYADKIRFCNNTGWWNMDQLANVHCDNAVIFLKYWRDAKSYMNNEIIDQREVAKLIENFEI